MNKLAIIVPYRNREEHLKKFSPHIHNFLKNKINFKLFVIEQNNNKSFNRGMLKNIGFSLADKECDYVCFHDVDHIPVSDSCDYSMPKQVVKLATYVSQFGFMKRPSEELAGVILFNKDVFKQINGFCNDYWGWGIEDDDLGFRCVKKGYTIETREGRYLSLPHKSEGDTVGSNGPSIETINNRKLFSELKNDEKRLFSSGLSTLKFNIDSTENHTLYDLIKVNF